MPDDLIVSKLARLEPKDKTFVEAYNAERPVDPEVIEQRLRDSTIEPAATERAIAYVRTLISKHNDNAGT